MPKLKQFLFTFYLKVQCTCFLCFPKNRNNIPRSRLLNFVPEICPCETFKTRNVVGLKQSFLIHSLILDTWNFRLCTYTSAPESIYFRPNILISLSVRVYPGNNWFYHVSCETIMDIYSRLANCLEFDNTEIYNISDVDMKLHRVNPQLCGQNQCSGITYQMTASNEVWLHEHCLKA